MMTTTVAPSVTAFLLLHRVCPPQLLLMLLVIRAQQQTLLYPLLALPVPTAEQSQAVSSRHRATIPAMMMIPAVTAIGHWDGSGIIPPPLDNCGRGDDPGGHCHWTSGWEIAPKRETAPWLPRAPPLPPRSCHPPPLAVSGHQRRQQETVVNLL
jgi:hypothetical protein